MKVQAMLTNMGILIEDTDDYTCAVLVPEEDLAGLIKQLDGILEDM